MLRKPANSWADDTEVKDVENECKVFKYLLYDSLSLACHCNKPLNNTKLSLHSTDSLLNWLSHIRRVIKVLPVCKISYQSGIMTNVDLEWRKSHVNSVLTVQTCKTSDPNWILDHIWKWANSKLKTWDSMWFVFLTLSWNKNESHITELHMRFGPHLPAVWT